MPKVIFIDRDGVINEDPIGDYIKDVDDFKFLDGVLEALRQLSEAGFEIVIISNQAGIGDGEYTQEDLDEITHFMLLSMKAYGVRIAGVYYCLHGKQEGCDCRKPKTGLFDEAEKEIPFSREGTFFIGDKITDVEAGRNFGLKTIYTLTGHGKLQKKDLDKKNPPDHITRDLTDAVKIVLNQQ